MTQFYSRVDTEFNGDVYSIPFSYIKEEEIQVYIGDELYTDWYFLNDSQIKINNLPSDLPSNTIVSVRRLTDISKKEVEYTNNTLLNKENLNLSQDQLLHAVQEIYDNNIQFEIDTLKVIQENKEEVLENQQDFEDEVNHKIQEVSEAASKINALEEAVDTAVTAANTATEQVNIVSDITKEIDEQIEEITTIGTNVGGKLPIFTPMWTDHINNDVSYLRADTFSWHYANIYKSAYESLVLEYFDENSVEQTENGIVYKLTPNGFKIANIDQQDAIIELYESDERAWFYIIDTTEGKFKLPREKSPAGKYLYFYVGFFDRPKTTIDTGKISEELNNKVDIDGENYKGSELEKIIKNSSSGLEIGDIGIAPLGIDETQGKRRYLNGQVIIQEQYKQFTKKLKTASQLYPSLVCTENDWQTIATMSVGGQVGKFVVDNEGGTIRLPKIIMPIQGLTNLVNLAEMVEAGLPPLEGDFDAYFITAAGNVQGTGAFANNNSGAANQIGAYSSKNCTRVNLNFDASQSNLTYGNSNTVQQEQIQYPYFIQVATGSETEDNIINEIELNNPYSFGDCKYTVVELNNISWLKSLGQWNSNVDYIDYYNWILTNANEGKELFKLFTQEYNDYDWVVNTSDSTFRLPLKVNLASGKAVVGNGKTLGLTDGNQNAGLQSLSGAGLFGAPRNYGSDVGTPAVNEGFSAQKLVGVTTDPTKSGLDTSDSNLYLYFYVGETVQNANLVNVGRIEEKIANLIPDNSELITNYSMPDYSAGVDITFPKDASTAFTAPCDGYYIGCFVWSGASVKCQLYINGVASGYYYENSSGYVADRDGHTVPLAKGDTIYWSGGSGNFTLRTSIFYPCKGVN